MSYHNLLSSRFAKILFAVVLGGFFLTPQIIKAQDIERAIKSLEDAKDNAEEIAIKKEENKKAAEKHKKLIADLFQFFPSKDQKTVIEAGLALKKFAQPIDVPQILEGLRKGYIQEAQIALIEALPRLKDTRALDPLRFEAEHGEVAVQAAAITALGNFKNDWSIPILTEILLNNPNLELRKRAASALGTIKSSQSIYALRNSLPAVRKDTYHSVFWAMATATQHIDPSVISADLPPGRKRLVLRYKGAQYYFYHPSYRPINSPKPRLLVCIHDADLAARSVFDRCRPYVKDHQMALLVPLFDNVHYPDYRDFNIRGERADIRLLEIIDFVTKKVDLETREFFLYGHGLGGDFVQRFALAYPERIARAAFASYDYTFPDESQLFPGGLAKTPLAPDIEINFKKFIKADVAMFLVSTNNLKRTIEKYLQAVSEYSDLQGMMSRLALRELGSMEDPERSLQLGMEYLFRRN